MKKYIALLRGINVGGNFKVAMKDLKQLIEKQGYQNVVTYINSGNVILESDQTTTQTQAVLEAACTKYFGFDLKILLVSESLFVSIASSIPPSWHNDKQQKTDVIFLWDKIDTKEIVQRFVVDQDKEHLVYTPGALVWNISREYQNHSKVTKAMLQKDIYSQVTIRNINTVRKLIQLLQS